MIPAVLTGLAVWCAIPVSSNARARSLFTSRPVQRRLDPGLTAALLTPLAATVLLGMPMGPVVGIVLAPLVRRSVGRLESAPTRRRAALVTAGLPAALDLMVAALEVGRPPVTAFALAAEATADPLGTELGLVAGRLRIAADADSVWQSVVDHESLAPVGRAFRRAESSGMPVAQVVSAVADELRRDHSARRRELGRKVGVRTAAPLGACFLPAFFLIGVVPTVLATFRTFAW